LETFEIAQDWLAKLIPHGICVPSSTIITGPAGAAKELISSMIAASWLSKGGSLLHILTNYDRDHAEKLFSYHNVITNSFAGKIVYIAFDPQMKDFIKTGNDELRANLLNPDVFEATINKAKTMLLKSNSEILTYMNAMNMLLYSKTYGTAIFNKYLTMVKDGQHYLFGLSNNVFPQKMHKIENASDNIIYVHGTGIMRLGLKIMKMKEVPFGQKEIETPHTEELISMHLRTIQKRRQTFVPIIRKI
jgi:hypothetical protein